MTHVLFSGYTDRTGTGIYRADFSNKTGLKPARTLIRVGAPTYLQQDHNLLFAIKRLPAQGGIASFSLKTGQPLDQHLNPGPSPAYIKIDPDQQRLFAANYHSGRLSVFHYTTSGQLTLLAECLRQGHSLRPEQASAHPHFLAPTPDDHLVCCDLGTDELAFYDLRSTGLKEIKSLSLPAGSGPRHLVFDQVHRKIYVACELASCIQAIAWDQKSSTFRLEQRISTTAASYQGRNGAAAIRLSADSRFLYASNRGENSLVVFKITEAGLELIQRISTFGSFPRDFNWDAHQRFVIAANQESDNATLYQRNAKTGMLAVLQTDFPVPQPTCVLFERS